MIFPNEDSWRAWGISHELHRFFVLRWNEIFSEETFDSWQVRFANVRSILNEILEAANVAEEAPNSHKSILILVDEAIHCAQNDIIIRESFPFVDGYLKRLKTEYQRSVKDLSKRNLDILRSLTRIILGHIEKYREKLFSRVNDLIENPPEQYKIVLDSLIMSLGIELKSMGYSIHHLRNAFDIFTVESVESFPRRFNKFLSKCDGRMIDYECSFLISLPGDIPNLDSYSIKIFRGRPEMFSEEEVTFYKQDNNPLVAMVKVSCCDPYSARDAAEQIMESIFAVSKFYQVSRLAKIRHDLVLVKEASNNDVFHLIKPDTSRLGYIRDAKEPTKSIEFFARLQGRLKPEDADQLMASMQYHKMAMYASTDDSRLVNLWIALESLIGRGRRSIIDNICQYVPASIATDYVYQIVRNFPIAIRKFWRDSDTSTIRKLIRSSNKHLLDPRDLLTILLDEKDGALITKFYEFSEDHPLLRYRIFSLRTKVLKSAETLSKAIEAHRLNIDWQIRRIYSARNNVMHRGVCVPQTRQLIQHLHTYFIIEMNTVINDLNWNSSWGIGEALEHRCVLYETLQNRLKEYDQKAISQEEIFNPHKILFLKDRTPPLFWTSG